MKRLIVVPVLLVTLLAAGMVQAQEGEECEEGTEGCVPDCPTNLNGHEPETGGVFMSWQLNSATDVNVYRAVADGDFVLLERLEFPATRYIDHDVEPGVTYRYQVTAVAEEESEACDTFEITTIPDLGSVFAMGAAAVLGLGAYVIRRRT